MSASPRVGETQTWSIRTRQASPTRERSSLEKEQGAILESGFGQGDDEYVGLVAIVKNKSDHAGQTVTVSFNIKDASGE